MVSKEIGLEVNADKTKYMVMSREQTARRSHTMRIDNRSFERVEQFKYLGTTLTNQNSIQEEIKSRLKLGNACYHSVQNLLSSSLLSKNIKIKVYTTTAFLLFCMGVKLGQNKKKRPPSSHCLRTVQTVTPVIRLWKGNEGTILVT